MLQLKLRISTRSFGSKACNGQRFAPRWPHLYPTLLVHDQSPLGSSCLLQWTRSQLAIVQATASDHASGEIVGLQVQIRRGRIDYRTQAEAVAISESLSASRSCQCYLIRTLPSASGCQLVRLQVGFTRMRRIHTVPRYNYPKPPNLRDLAAPLLVVGPFKFWTRMYTLLQHIVFKLPLHCQPGPEWFAVLVAISLYCACVR